MSTPKLLKIKDIAQDLNNLEKEILVQHGNTKVYLPLEENKYGDYDFITMKKLICAYHTWCDTEMDEWKGLIKEAVYILNFIGDWAHQRKIIRFIVEYCDAKGFNVELFTKQDIMRKYFEWKEKQPWGEYEDDFIIEDAYHQYIHFFHTSMNKENKDESFLQEIKQCIIDIERAL